MSFGQPPSPKQDGFVLLFPLSSDTDIGASVIERHRLNDDGSLTLLNYAANFVSLDLIGFPGAIIGVFAGVVAGPLIWVIGVSGAGTLIVARLDVNTLRRVDAWDSGLITTPGSAFATVISDPIGGDIWISPTDPVGAYIWRFRSDGTLEAPEVIATTFAGVNYSVISMKFHNGFIIALAVDLGASVLTTVKIRVRDGAPGIVSVGAVTFPIGPDPGGFDFDERGTFYSSWIDPTAIASWPQPTGALSLTSLIADPAPLLQTPVQVAIDRANGVAFWTTFDRLAGTGSVVQKIVIGEAGTPTAYQGLVKTEHDFIGGGFRGVQGPVIGPRFPYACVAYLVTGTPDQGGEIVALNQSCSAVATTVVGVTRWLTPDQRTNTPVAMLIAAVPDIIPPNDVLYVAQFPQGVGSSALEVFNRYDSGSVVTPGVFPPFNPVGALEDSAWGGAASLGEGVLVSPTLAWFIGSDTGTGFITIYEVTVGAIANPFFPINSYTTAVGAPFLSLLPLVLDPSGRAWFTASDNNVYFTTPGTCLPITTLVVAPAGFIIIAMNLGSDGYFYAAARSTVNGDVFLAKIDPFVGFEAVVAGSAAPLPSSFWPNTTPPADILIVGDRIYTVEASTAAPGTVITEWNRATLAVIASHTVSQGGSPVAPLSMFRLVYDSFSDRIWATGFGFIGSPGIVRFTRQGVVDYHEPTAGLAISHLLIDQQRRTGFLGVSDIGAGVSAVVAFDTANPRRIAVSRVSRGSNPYGANSLPLGLLLVK